MTLVTKTSTFDSTLLFHSSSDGQAVILPSTLMTSRSKLQRHP